MLRQAASILICIEAMYSGGKIFERYGISSVKVGAILSKW